MLEFETFVYLPLQKTGSSFVASFFERFCRERLLDDSGHTPVDAEKYDPSKLYLISVRNPLEQYISLYSFGVTGGGRLYGRMRRLGYDSLYDGTAEGFSFWLRTVLRPSSADMLDRDYGALENSKVAHLIGYQSYRYLKLAVPSAGKAMGRCQTQDELRTAYKEGNIVGFTLRTETLNADLAALIQTRLRTSMTNLDEALTYLQNAPPVNASERIDRYGQLDLAPKSLRRLKEREWLMYEIFDF
jgi:hypothetical protein